MREDIDTRLLVAFLVVCVCIAAFAAVQLATGLQPYAQSEQEYDELRRDYAPDAAPVLPAATDDIQPAQAAPLPTGQAHAPAEVNPDYVGWIAIDGVGVDYPVARGEDNDKYLTTSFSGAENKLGAIFLDYRCVDGFDAPNAVVYGHNARDGSMFGSLHRLLELGPEDWPDITVTLPDGTALAYHIFAVRETDKDDPAYRLDFADDADFADFAAGIGAPDGVTNLLTLSTCTNSGSSDDRLLVHAALE